MKKLLILPILFAGLSFAVAINWAAEAETKKEAALICKCNCRNCPPNSTLSKNKDNAFRYRRCFRDTNKDGICDSSVKAGQKCGNDCLIATAEDAKKQNKTIQLACANCPCAANCTACTGK